MPFATASGLKPASPMMLHISNATKRSTQRRKSEEGDLLVRRQAKRPTWQARKRVSGKRRLPLKKAAQPVPVREYLARKKNRKKEYALHT